MTYRAPRKNKNSGVILILEIRCAISYEVFPTNKITMPPSFTVILNNSNGKKTLNDAVDRIHETTGAWIFLLYLYIE